MRINESKIDSITTHLEIAGFLNEVAKLNPTPLDIGLLLERIRIHTRTSPKWTGSPATKQYLREVWDDISDGDGAKEDIEQTPAPKSAVSKKTKSQEDR